MPRKYQKLILILAIILFVQVGRVQASFDMNDPYGSNALAEELTVLADEGIYSPWEKTSNPYIMAMNLVLLGMTSLMIILMTTMIHVYVVWHNDGNNLGERKKIRGAIEGSVYGFLVITVIVIIYFVLYLNFARFSSVFTGFLESIAL